MVILLLSPIRKLVRNAVNKLLYVRKYFIKFSVQRTCKIWCSYGKGIVWKNSFPSDRFSKAYTRSLGCVGDAVLPVVLNTTVKKSHKPKR